MKRVAVNALCLTEVMFPDERFLKQPSCSFCSDSVHASLRMVMLLPAKARQRMISMKMRCVRSRHYVFLALFWLQSKPRESLTRSWEQWSTHYSSGELHTIKKSLLSLQVQALGSKSWTSELAASSLSYNANNSPSAPPAETYPLITQALKTFKVLSITKGINSCIELMSLH